MVRCGFVMIGAALLGACTSTVDGQGGGGEPNGSPASSGGTSSGGTSGAATSGGSFQDPTGSGATRPPPTIASVAPLAGDYGTEVTITGDNLDETSAELVLGSTGDPLKLPLPTAGTGAGNPADVVLAWSKTQIRFKYPFPADGVVGVTTKSGQAQGGTFVPSWAPGTPVAGVFTRRELLGIVSPSAATLVAAFDGDTGPQVLVASSGAVTARAFDRGATALLTMSLVTTSAGVEGFYASGGTLFHLTDAAGTPEVASTGVAAVGAAGGVDASGAYAWIRKSNGTVVRVRPPSWAESGAAVTDPTPASAPGPSMAVATDGALFVGWGVNDGGSFPFYDNTTSPVVQRLRSGQTTFDAVRSVGGPADDAMIWTRFRAGPGGRVYSYYCANNTGFFGGSSLDCGEGYIDGLGTLSTPVDATAGVRLSGWNDSVAVTAACDPATSTLSLGPEGQTASAKPVLFPCPEILGVHPDASGDPMLLVSAGGYVYQPRKR